MWILFSIVAAVFWAVVNIVDKVTISKLIKKPIVVTILLSFIDVVIAIIILLNDFVLITWLQFILFVVVSSCCVFGTIFYFRAIRKEEASRVVPLFSLSLIWIMVIAAIFLDEVFGLKEYFGIIIIFLGSVLISIKKKVKFKISGSFFLMIGSTLLFAINNVVQKYLLEDLKFWTVFAYTGLLFFILLIPAAIFYRKELIKTIKRTKYKGIGALMSISILDSLGAVFFLIALSFGYVTFVEAVASTQYVFLFLLTIFLSVLFPKIFREKITKPIVILKLTAIILITGGIILIA